MTLLGRICSRSDREKTIYHFEHHNAHFDHFGDDTVEEPWVGDLRSGTISEDEFRATAYYWISVMHGSGLIYYYNVWFLSNTYESYPTCMTCILSNMCDLIHTCAIKFVHFNNK